MEAPKDRSKLSKKEFARDLEKRTRDFAVRIIRLSLKLPNTPEGRAVRNQITKSGTSVGANYREAGGPEAGPTSEIRLKSAKVKPVKPNIGSKSL